MKVNGGGRELLLLYNDRGAPVDGIRAYTGRLAECLESRPDVSVRRSVHSGQGAFRDAARSLRESAATGEAALVVQYNPFSFARWGFAPWLPYELLRLRRQHVRPRIAIMVHEPFVAMEDLGSTVMGAWQRAQLSGIWAAADVVFVSIEPWRDRARPWVPSRPVFHLPVGSNLPDMRAARDQERAALGLGEGDIAIAAIGRDHPSWLGDQLYAAAAAVANAGVVPTVLLLGADAPDVRGLDAVARVYRFGGLPDEQMARSLAAADVFIAPLIDGVSTRRTTLMAALQHGIAVVGTDGPLTDRELRDAGHALALVPLDRVQELGERVRTLTEDRGRLRAMGAAGRRMYERSYAWPAITERMLGPLFSDA